MAAGNNNSDLTYIFMVDQFHELKLSVGPFGMRYILERSAQFFDGHILLGYTVIRSTAKKMHTLGNFFDKSTQMMNIFK
jgi:hypothetical protein